MAIHEFDGMCALTFDSLDSHGIKHAVFMRHGGVSPAPWASLNFGALVGDDPANVAENYRRAFSALGIRVESKYDVWQVHSATVAIAHAPRPTQVPHVQADAILSDRPDVTLFMRFADCVPIFLYDPHQRVVGVVHAGWQGTLLRTAGQAVKGMVEGFDVRAADILAVIGPSIGVRRYEIGEDVAEKVRQAFPEEATEILPELDGKTHFDLWAANRLILNRCGVKQVETAGICTAENSQDWFSHRAEKGKTGRFGVLITLQV
jgi:YfiH family protein